MENKREKSSILVQGSILAVTGLLVRFISVLYRIPMTNIIGDEGNGYYGAAYQVYNVILLLSSYSLPQAVSRLVSQCLAKKQFRNANRYFMCALVFATISGGFFSVLLYLGAGWFASLVGMPLAKFALQILAPTVFVVGFLGVFRGFFQGFHNMVPTAFSQLVEQIVNAVVSIVGVIYLSAAGHRTDLVCQTDGSYAASNGAAGGTLGTLAGAIAGLICVLVLFRMFYPAFRKRMKREPAHRIFKYSRIYKNLMATITPIVMSAVIFNIITLVDNVILSQALKGREIAENVIASKWGVFSGKYLLLINLPIAFATALASSVIPSIAAANTQRSKGEVVHRIDLVVKFTLLLSIPCFVGMSALSQPIISVLFSSDNSNATQLLLYGSLSIVFFSMATITNSILHGMGKMMLPVKHALIALAAHVVLLCVLLYGFKLDEYAVVFAYMLFGLVVWVLNMLFLSQQVMYRVSYMKLLVLPALVSAVMGILVFFINRLISQFVWNWLALLLAIFVGMMFYLVCILKLSVVDDDDLYELPFGQRLLNLAHRLHLLR